MSGDQQHERVNDILLGPLERPALQWLSARMPSWVTPDVLTLVGIAGSVITFAAYWATNLSPAWLWVASLGLVINWFGDSLDGTLARFRKIERPKYGYFVDHAVDAISESLVALGLGLSPYVSFPVAAMALIGYLLMSVHVYLTTYVRGLFKISYGKLGPTEVRVLIILANATLFFVGIPTVDIAGRSVIAYDIVFGFLAAALIVVFLVSTMQEARRLAVEDPGKR